MSSPATQRWLSAWYGQRRWTLWLLPVMVLFGALAGVRRWYQQRFTQVKLPVPVVVVGNISLGGTGKTPLLIALVHHLQAQGYVPGVISRGYGGRPPAWPYRVGPESTPAEAGDEPLLIARATGCPVCVAPDRVAAAQALIQAGCDLLLSDDGLQHYRLGRDLEIAVVDGQRLLGNGHCLPVGPLREPPVRLKQVDMVVLNSPTDPDALQELLAPARSHTMHIAPDHWARVADDQPLGLETLAPGTAVAAVAGIGNPQRFYGTLAQLGLVVEGRDFPDHHQFVASDLADAGDRPLVMTAKDAIKCRELAQVRADHSGADWYYLAVSARLDDCFWRAFDAKIAALGLTPR